MAEICQSPFDGDKYYDIDVIGELDKQIFDASVAIFSSQIWSIPDKNKMDRCLSMPVRKMSNSSLGV